MALNLPAGILPARSPEVIGAQREAKQGLSS
jgi:hypothetical protein